MQKHKKNIVIASIFTGIVLAWLAVGTLYHEVAPASQDSKESTKADNFTVSVKTSQAQQIMQTVSAQGSTEPHRSVTIRAQTSGQVDSIDIDIGSMVNKNQVIAKLQIDDRNVQLKEAKALLNQKKTEFEANQALQKKGYIATIQQEKSRAELESAVAAIERIQLDIARTKIKAPFSGIIEQRHVTIGDYVNVAGDIATLVDNNPLRVVIHLSEQHIQKIAKGQEAQVTINNGKKARPATVSAISPRSDEKTRTFRVELSLPNEQQYPAGGSISVTIPVAKISAHQVSPALLSLDDDENLSIKTVNSNGKVVLHAVSIVKSEPNGVWVSGLPDEVQLITQGGGFTMPGEKVSIQKSGKKNSEQTQP